MQEQVKYWLKSAEHDLEAAEALYEKGKYDWCLFLGHLVLEKILKAFYVRDNQELPPKIHKLDLIASKTQLALTQEQVDFLREINDFNLEVRYPDEKLVFYKLCTKEFSEKYFNAIKDFYQCLLTKLK